jgi:AcrR family transcriptional regulator
MRQVATAAGLTLGALYHHFESKDALFEAVFADANPFALVPPALEASQGENVEALLQDAARRLHGSLHERSELLRFVFIDLLEFQGRHIAGVLIANAPSVLAFVARAQALGSDLRPLPPYLLARSFIGLLSAWFLADVFFMGRMPPSLAELRIEDAVDVFLRGALVRDAAPEPDATNGENRS